MKSDYPPRGQIRATEDDSLAIRLPDEPYVGRLAQLIASATARSPSSRPTLMHFRDDLDSWLEARQTPDDFAVDYESADARSLAVFRWLVDTVRTNPVYTGLQYDLSNLDAPSDVPGLTERQMGEALQDLIELVRITGEPLQVMGRREPLRYTRLYPTAYGFSVLGELDELLEQAAPVLRAFITPLDWLHLPDSNDLIELPGGLSRTGPEAYFQMWVLQSQGWLDFSIAEAGPGISLSNVRCNAIGRARLYESGQAGR